MSGRREAWAGTLFALAAALALVTGVIRLLACDAGLWEREMLRFAPPERTGLPEASYPAMAEHIAAFLAGKTDSFQFELAGPNGETRPCFHDYELIHMADCRGLIRLDGWVCLGSLLTAAGCLAVRLCRGRAGAPGFRRGAAQGGIVLAVLAAAGIIWAAVDFDGLFWTFHRAAFRNDYWLLNPRTDLLIRLMPEELFVDLGIRGLALLTAGAGLLAAGGLLARRAGRRAGSGTESAPESGKEGNEA